MYEDPDEMELPPASPSQWPPPYDEIQRQSAAEMPATKQIGPDFNDEQPTLPEKQRKRRCSSNPAPPVPTTRRPSDTVAPGRLRSVTDIPQPPPVPNTRRPSEGTVPNMSRILNRSESNPTQPTGAKWRQLENSGRDVSLRRSSVEAQPPPLVPRTRKLSEADTSQMRSNTSSPLSISGQAGQETPLYSNMLPISEANERPNDENDDHDDHDGDSDAAGYIKCVASREDPRIH